MNVHIYVYVCVCVCVCVCVRACVRACVRVCVCLSNAYEKHKFSEVSSVFKPLPSL